MQLSKSVARRAMHVIIGVVVCGGVVAIGQTPAVAADESTRPYFQIPFSCATTVRMETGPSHDNYAGGVWRRDKAVDMYNPPAGGTPVMAAAAGRVRVIAGSGVAELLVDHGNGWSSQYLHMTNLVANGTWVNRGQQVGVVGSYGTGSPHLHFEERYNNVITTLKFNGREFRLSNGQPYSMTLVSNNCSGMIPATYCPYRVTTGHDKKSWAGTGFDSEGFLAAGTNVWASQEVYSFSGSTNWRRSTLPTGADQNGAFLRSIYLTRVSGSCFS